MFGKKKRTITVQDEPISIIDVEGEDYISLTDMVRRQEGDDHIKNWMRNRNTVEFLGLWETMHNPDFKPVEFDGFRKEAGLNKFTLAPQKWIEATAAKGLISKSGRYGGTYAHKDIALEFGTWLSPAFKLHVLKEYQRLKDLESNEHNLEWHVRRVLAKNNYKLHTDAVKEHVIPAASFFQKKYAYANEADLLNLAVFGMDAKQWREENPQLAKKGMNIRDTASYHELNVLGIVEAKNSDLLHQGVVDKGERGKQLTITAERLLNQLADLDFMGTIKRTTPDVYLIENHKDKK